MNCDKLQKYFSSSTWLYLYGTQLLRNQRMSSTLSMGCSPASQSISSSLGLNRPVMLVNSMMRWSLSAVRSLTISLKSSSPMLRNPLQLMIVRSGVHYSACLEIISCHSHLRSTAPSKMGFPACDCEQALLKYSEFNGYKIMFSLYGKGVPSTSVGLISRNRSQECAVFMLTKSASTQNSSHPFSNLLSMISMPKGYWKTLIYLTFQGKVHATLRLRQVSLPSRFRNNILGGLGLRLRVNARGTESGWTDQLREGVSGCARRRMLRMLPVVTCRMKYFTYWQNQKRQKLSILSFLDQACSFTQRRQCQYCQKANQRSKSSDVSARPSFSYSNSNLPLTLAPISFNPSKISPKSLKFSSSVSQNCSWKNPYIYFKITTSSLSFRSSLSILISLQFCS